MHRQDFLNCLDFHDDFALNQQIKPVTVLEVEIVIHNRNDSLGQHMHSGVSQFVHETCSVDALQETWSQF